MLKRKFLENIYAANNQKYPLYPASTSTSPIEKMPAINQSFGSNTRPIIRYHSHKRPSVKMHASACNLVFIHTQSSE